MDVTHKFIKQFEFAFALHWTKASSSNMSSWGPMEIYLDVVERLSSQPRNGSNSPEYAWRTYITPRSDLFLHSGCIYKHPNTKDLSVGQANTLSVRERIRDISRQLVPQPLHQQCLRVSFRAPTGIGFTSWHVRRSSKPVKILNQKFRPENYLEFINDTRTQRVSELSVKSTLLTSHERCLPSNPNTGWRNPIMMFADA